MHCTKRFEFPLLPLGATEFCAETKAPQTTQMSEQSQHFSLGIGNGPHDLLRNGVRNLEGEAKAPHPVAALQRNADDAEWAQKVDMVRRTYGSHLAMRISAEKVACGRHQRQAGLEATNVNLQTVLGNDTKLEFSDFLNLPANRPVGPVADLHSATELQMGLI
jgi:hypothetical protein